jgi:hypothetical protein
MSDGFCLPDHSGMMNRTLSTKKREKKKEKKRGVACTRVQRKLPDKSSLWRPMKGI